MIKTPTAFILGAGASAPYGFPTGKKLREDICTDFENDVSTLASDYPRIDSFEQELIEENAKNFVEAFSKSTSSIDLFLATTRDMPGFVDNGKMAIVLNILKAEKNSVFRENVESQDKDWYSQLFQTMTRELTRPEDYVNFSQNKVAFITFNYDRSLEQFLYQSLRHRFRSIAHDKIVSQIEKLPVVHVYGKIDDLPWRGGRTYRAHFDFDSLQQLKKNIRTIYETQEGAADQIMKAQTILGEWAKRIFFLGFGYAKENLQAFDTQSLLNGKQKIFGTALGSIGPEIKTIWGDLRKGFEDKDPGIKNPRIENVDCRQLLRLYPLV